MTEGDEEKQALAEATLGEAMADGILQLIGSIPINVATNLIERMTVAVFVGIEFANPRDALPEFDRWCDHMRDQIKDQIKDRTQ